MCPIGRADGGRDGLLAAWTALSLMQRRAIVDAVADITVLPCKPTTRGFDPDGVAVQWKTRRRG